MAHTRKTRPAVRRHKTTLHLTPLEDRTVPAGAIISPVGATINAGGPGFGSIGDTFNQSGLSSGFVSGTTDFDTYIASGPTHTLIFSGYEWFSNENTTGATVTYDLGSVKSIDRLALWNEESSGIGTLDLYSSTDGVTFAPLSIGLHPPDNPYADYPATVFNFAATSTRYVRFVISDSPQPNPAGFPGAAIGEVAFREADGDLSVKIGTNIVPTQAKDLALRHFFGSETLSIPATIHNGTGETLSGQVKVEVFLSTTADMDGVIGKAIGTKTEKLNKLGAGKDQEFVVPTQAIPIAGLTAGDEYHFVVKITPVGKLADHDADEDDDVSGSENDYEYVGNPGGFFQQNMYFEAVRRAITGGTAGVNFAGAPTPTTREEFTAAFETPGGYANPVLIPYLDTASPPKATIGIGLNISALTPSEKDELATAVKALYSQYAATMVPGYQNIDALSTAQVMAMLTTQAQQNSSIKKVHDARPALSVQQAQDLYDLVYARHADEAEAYVAGRGGDWDSLPEYLKWTLVDIAFNAGALSQFSGMGTALFGGDEPDYVRAGFEMIDSKRTGQIGIIRSAADYAFLVLAGGTPEYLGSLAT